MILSLALLLSMASEMPPVRIEVLRSVTVYESNEHLNFPWVFRGPDNFLSLSCSIGQHTVDERSMALVSQDDGETWTRPAEPAAGGMATLLSDGRAVLLSCWGPAPLEPGKGVYPAKTLYYADGGRSVVETIESRVHLPFLMKPHFHRSLVEMPGGVLLATIYGTREEHKKYTSVLLRTRDGGKNWHFLSVIAHSEDVGAEGFCEPALVRLENGDLLCALRVGGPLYTTRSTDNGATWSPPQVVAGHGVNPDLLLMKSGVLVLSFGRPNVDLLFSADGAGHQWDTGLTLYKGPGCSYTSLIEAANGDLMVFFAQSGFCDIIGTGPLNMIRLARLSVTRTSMKN
jgi:hypothetical protein